MVAELPPPRVVGHVKSYRDPDNICTSCADFWISKGKQPRILVEIPRRADYGTIIYCCPWCDGPVAEHIEP